MKPTVVLQTDFGNGGGGVMAGVIRSVDPEVPVYDFDHYIEAYNPVAASSSLSGAVPYWPAGTVFVSVVDPGVGTDRRSCVAKLNNGSYVVTPDNGTLTMLKDMVTEVRLIDESVNRLPGSENCYIYHGRDVYAYTAARLAAGVISYEEVGPEYPVADITAVTLTNVETVVRNGYAHAGFYDMEKAFGCLRVNITTRDFQETGGFRYGDRLHLVIEGGGRVIYDGICYYDKTFGLAPKKEAFLSGDIQTGDGQTLRFNLNEDNFFDKYAPELNNGLGAAKDYSFTATPWDGDL